MILDINEIKVSKAFKNSNPSQLKYDACMDKFKKYGQHKDIVVKKVGDKYEIIDGYIMYLVMRDLGHDKFECTNGNKTMYAHCKHVGQITDKDYVFRVKKKDVGKIKVGDTVNANTKYGLNRVIVNALEVSDVPPVEFKVRSIFPLKS